MGFPVELCHPADMANYPGVKRRTDGKSGYVAWASLRQPDGTYKNKRIHGATAKECHENKKLAVDDHKAGVIKSKEVTTIGDLTREWHAWWLARTPDAAQNTLDDYQYGVDLICRFMGKIKLDLPLPELAQAIEAGFSEMLLRGKTRGTRPRKDYQPKHPARIWAEANGYDLPKTGRLKPSVIQAWADAGSPRPPEPAPDTRKWHQIPAEEKKNYRLSNMTVVGVRRKFDMVCDYGMGIKPYFRDHPLKYVKKIERIANKEKVAFTEEQFARVSDALLTESEEVQVRWVAAITLALRQGEVLALRWSNIDFEEMTILINSQVERLPWLHGCEEPSECGLQYKEMFRASKCPHRHSGGLVIKTTTKGKDSTHVPMSNLLAELLKAHKRSQNEVRLLLGPEWQDNDLVFCAPTGGLIDPKRDWKAWQALLIKHGLPADAGTHSAKHTGITIAFDRKVDEMIISKVLARHKSGVSFTRAQYQKLRGRKAAGEALRAVWDTAVNER